MLANLLSSPTISFLTVGAGVVCTFLLGTWTPLLTALLVVQFADVVTGFMAGGKDRDISSSTFFAGLKKKVGMWILLILANVVDVTFLGGVPVLKSAVSGFLVAGEGLSLVENLGRIGVPIHPKIKQLLTQLRDENSDLKIEKGED